MLIPLVKGINADTLNIIDSFLAESSLLLRLAQSLDMVTMVIVVMVMVTW